MQRRWPAAAFLLALAAALLLPERGLRAAPARRTPAPMPVAAPLRNAFILSFRSPDLVTNEPDERWGRRDDRLRPGMILTDLPPWLAWKLRDVQQAREEMEVLFTFLALGIVMNIRMRRFVN